MSMCLVETGVSMLNDAPQEHECLKQLKKRHAELVKASKQVRATVRSVRTQKAIASACPEAVSSHPHEWNQHAPFWSCYSTWGIGGPSSTKLQIRGGLVCKDPSTNSWCFLLSMAHDKCI